MFSVQEMKRVDRELSLELTESPINPAFIHISAPLVNGYDPLFYLQINGEALWKWREFKMDLTRIFHALQDSLASIGYQLNSSSEVRVATAVKGRVYHTLKRVTSETNGEKRKNFRSQYWAKIGKKVQNLTGRILPRLRDLLSNVKLLLTTHVNNPFHGLKCKVGKQLSNTFPKSIHIHFTKDFNEVLFLQLKKTRKHSTKFRIKQFIKVIYNEINSLTLYMKHIQSITTYNAGRVLLNAFNPTQRSLFRTTWVSYLPVLLEWTIHQSRIPDKRWSIDFHLQPKVTYSIPGKNKRIECIGLPCDTKTIESNRKINLFLHDHFLFSYGGGGGWWWCKKN